MKTCAKCGESLPLDSFWKKPNGNLRPYCKACMRADNKRWVAENRDRDARYKAAWKQNNPDKVRAASQLRYQTSDVFRRAIAAWGKANKDLKLAYTAKRRAAKLRAIPPWADMKKINAIYAEAAAIRALGVDCHVDHIVPLQGSNVSGLHVHYNLQLLLAADNLSKGNKAPCP
jgi:hypothetical protein